MNHPWKCARLTWPNDLSESEQPLTVSGVISVCLAGRLSAESLWRLRKTSTKETADKAKKSPLPCRIEIVAVDELLSLSQPSLEGEEMQVRGQRRRTQLQIHLDVDEQVVAIKQLNLDGLQGNKEFLVEVLMLIMLRHENLVSLIGYCADGDERLLVYEYMPKGSLEDHLFDPSLSKPHLEWNTRINIAVGVAKGLTYLHDVANPPVIYRDMKAANVLLDNDFNPKLSDFGLAKLGPDGDNTHVSTRVMGTYGYCAPDYALSGKLTMKSDVYSFGVLLLELITGQRAFDSSRIGGEQYLTNWVSDLNHGETPPAEHIREPKMLGRQFMWLAVRGGGQERRFPRPRHAAVTDSPSRVSLLRDSEKTEKGMDAMAHSSPANSFLPSSPPSFYIDRNWFIEFPTRSVILPKPLYW
ncbi:hypothetical protein BHE74_00032473 [Ensete ventricosum]|nr:hypothetical protein BHE74_00032473 [Ensete ventricosum]